MKLIACVAFLGLVAGAHAQGSIHYQRPNDAARTDLPGAPLTQAQQDAAWKAYAAAAGKFCPRQRLTLQSPEQMNLQVQSFSRIISPPQDKRYRQFASEACDLGKPAAACANTAMLAAANEGKFLDRFTVFECETGLKCTAQGKCAVPR